MSSERSPVITTANDTLQQFHQQRRVDAHVVDLRGERS